MNSTLLSRVLIAFALAFNSAAGRAAIRIVIPPNPAPPEQFAAQELVRYFRLMGTPDTQVANDPAPGEIYLGTFPRFVPATKKEAAVSGLSGKDADSFLLRSFGNRLVIFGNSPRANLFGAYAYLESLGVRWYFPEKEHEVIPRAAIRLDGYDAIEIPSFRKRGLCIFATTPGLRELVDFAAKARLNAIGVHTLPSQPPLSDAGYETVARAVGPRGLRIDIERHFFGERFCPDDQAVLEKEKATLKKYLRTLPAEMNDFFLWAADTYLPACNSPAYQGYSVSDVVLWFSNQIAASLREERPAGRFAFLAYLATEQPPQHVKPATGVLLEWAPIRQSFAHAIDDPASQISRGYRDNFEAYLKLFRPEDVQVLGYWLDDTLFNRTNYGRLPYNPSAMKGDLAYYHRANVRDITTFGVITGRDYFESHVSPAVFLYPKLLWNIESEPRAIVAQFCRDYFGSPAALEIFDLLAAADRTVYVEEHKVHAALANESRFLETVNGALRLSEKLVQDQTDPVKRMRAARLVQEVSERFAHIGR